jgi:hypothetical protein
MNMKRRTFLSRLVGSAILGRFLPKVLAKAPAAVVAQTTTANAQAFSAWVFPVIRNMSPSDVLTDLVSVQPMTAPSGNVMYLDFKTDSKPDPNGCLL